MKGASLFSGVSFYASTPGCPFFSEITSMLRVSKFQRSELSEFVDSIALKILFPFCPPDGAPSSGVERSGAQRSDCMECRGAGMQARQIGRQASWQANRPSISPSNIAVDSPLYASCPLYKRERAAGAAPVGPPPLSLGRLKFNSGTAGWHGCQIVPRSSSLSLATVRYRTFDLHRARSAGRFSSRRYHRVAETMQGKF